MDSDVVTAEDKEYCEEVLMEPHLRLQVNMHPDSGTESGCMLH